MATLLIRLNDAPADEVDELRQLLSAHGIDYYETHAGNWGFSVAGIWLRDEAQLAHARHLVDGYQEERRDRIRSHYEAERRAGRHETLALRLLSRPLQSLFYLLAILAVLYVTLMPFIGWP